MVDQSGLHCFNNYILPLRDVEIHATRVNGLSVLTVRGIRTLFKDNQPVETVSLGKSLENFLTYLEKTVRSVKSDNNIYKKIWLNLWFGTALCKTPMEFPATI